MCEGKQKKNGLILMFTDILVPVLAAMNKLP